MTAPEPTPTAEHVDAVARALAPTWPDDTRYAPGDAEGLAILTSKDPAVHAAMLDALVRAGVLTAGQAKFGALPIRPGDSFSGRAG